jgi:hypothetical protein
MMSAEEGTESGEVDSYGLERSRSEKNTASTE